MLKISYTILVTGSAYGTQNASSAFLFCKSIIAMNQSLYSVFFYCDGVYNANCMTKPATDEFNLIKAWKMLNKKYHVQLHVCISAALRRGIIKEKDISELNVVQDNMENEFKISGLMELAHSIQKCDRIIQF